MRIVNRSNEPFADVTVAAFSADRSLAVHASVGVKGWTVSHVRTGAAIVEGVRFKDAAAILDGAAFMYGREFRRIRFAAKPLAKSLKPGIAALIRSVMRERAPVWAMEA